MRASVAVAASKPVGNVAVAVAGTLALSGTKKALKNWTPPLSAKPWAKPACCGIGVAGAVAVGGDREAAAQRVAAGRELDGVVEAERGADAHDVADDVLLDGALIPHRVAVEAGAAREAGSGQRDGERRADLP